MSAMTYQRPASPVLPVRPRRLPRAAVDPRLLTVSASRAGALRGRPVPRAARTTSPAAHRDLGRDTSSAPALDRRATDRALGPVSTTAAPARLTRRGRVVVVLLLVAVALVVFSLGRASSEASPSGGAPAAPRPTTVVQSGDTLWSIARRIAPGSDPRVMVERLSDLNDLDGRPIQAGQRLTLPYGS